MNFAMQRSLAITGGRSPLASTSGVPQRGHTSLRVSCVARPHSAQRAAVQQRPSAQSTPVNGGLLGATTLLSSYLLDAHVALAKGGELGPALEGRAVSLIHPALMLFLLGSSFYTAWLGWQWRATRLIPAEIKERKALLPKPDEDGKRPSSPLDEEIAQLEQIRKDLAKGNYREKHWHWGSVLLGLGVAMGVAGPVNTYLRTGKLFPGPHLYAGAAIVVIWALAASLVPAMQKNNDTARYAHIGLNSINIGLFLWQVPTGWEIVVKVFQFTNWP